METPGFIYLATSVWQHSFLWRTVNGAHRKTIRLFRLPFSPLTGASYRCIPLLPPTLMPGNVWEGLYLLYLAGVVFLLARYLLAYLRLRGALLRGQGAEGAQIERVAAQYGLSSCRAVEVEGLSSAFVCGGLRPVLALPAGGVVDDKVLLRPSTPAAALNYYATALLTDNAAYLAAVRPLEDHPLLAASPSLDLPRPRPNSVWQVYNLLQGAAGDYQGLLCFQQMDSDSPGEIVAQTVVLTFGHFSTNSFLMAALFWSGLYAAISSN